MIISVPDVRKYYKMFSIQNQNSKFCFNIPIYLKLLIKNGYIYIEVPDGNAASRHHDNKFREEFFVDHLHVFSKKSLIKCVKLAGLSLLSCKSIKEKSGKLSLYAFAKKVV